MPLLLLLSLCCVLLRVLTSSVEARPPDGEDATRDAVEAARTHRWSSARVLHVGGTARALWAGYGGLRWVSLDEGGWRQGEPALLVEGPYAFSAVATPQGFAVVTESARARRGPLLYTGLLHRFRADGARLGEPARLYLSRQPVTTALFATAEGRLALVLQPQDSSEEVTSLTLLRFRADGASLGEPEHLGPYPRASLRWDAAMRGSTLLVATQYAIAPGRRGVFLRSLEFDAQRPPPAELVATEEAPDDADASLTLHEDLGLAWGLPQGVLLARFDASGALGAFTHVADAPLARHGASMARSQEEALLVLRGSDGYLSQWLSSDGARLGPPSFLRRGTALSAPLALHGSFLFLERSLEYGAPCRFSTFAVDSSNRFRNAECLEAFRP